MSWRSEWDPERLARVLKETEDLHPRLGEWLYAATEGVGVLGRERVIEDISAHYEEAFAAAAERGADDEQAHREALRLLGDAKAARKRFRREYMSVSVERYVLHAFGTVDSIRKLGYLWLLCGLFFFALELDDLTILTLSTALTDLVAGFLFIALGMICIRATKWRDTLQVRKLMQAQSFYLFPIAASVISAGSSFSYVLAALILFSAFGDIAQTLRMPATLTQSEFDSIEEAYAVPDDSDSPRPEGVDDLAYRYIDKK